MKKSHFKILLAILATLMLLASAFTIISFAEGKYAEVTFVESSSSYRKAVLKGEEIELPAPKPEESVGGQIYGWFDAEGNLYSVGQKIKPTENLTLYRAEGDEFALAPSLAAYCAKGYTYVKLKSNITLTEPIKLPKNKVLYIDLNGNTINIETESIKNPETGDEIPVGAFEGEDCGVIFVNSSENKSFVNHIAGGSIDFALNALISVSPSAEPQNLTFFVAENVSISTNMNFVSVQTDISSFPRALSVSIRGELTAGRVFRSNGIESASVKIHEGAKVASTSDYMFEDVAQAHNDIVILTVYGGEVTLKSALARNADRILPLIYGGRFSKDISLLIPGSNLVFELDGDGFYAYKDCNHAGPLVENVNCCDESCKEEHEHLTCQSPRTLTHRCVYCNKEFKLDYPNGVGHSFRMELVQEPINTKEETLAARYRTYCTRGDYERLEYAFPDPASVHVTVKYIDDDKNEKIIRVPSTDIYSFDESLKTKIMSFSVDSVYYLDEDGEKQHVAPESIFYVEVPLGTTDIYGELKNADNTPTFVGVFVNDYYLKEVALPISLVNVNNYAFFNMNSIEKITGIENISGTIGTAAFMQPTGTKLSYDYFEVNAQTIEKAAFGNILIKKAITIGEKTTSISDYAFALGLKADYKDKGKIIVDTTYVDLRKDEEKTKEIFILGYTGEDGVLLENAKTGMGKYHQFSAFSIVFKDHDYVSTSVPSTCISYGHDLFTCSRCHNEYTDNYVYVYSEHAYIPHRVEPTCQLVGFKGFKCTVCNSMLKEEDLRIEPNNHTYSAGVIKYAIGKDSSICVDPYYTLRQCGCGRIEPSTESKITFTFTGASEETKWNFFLLENGKVLIYKDGQRITSSTVASLTIENGVFKTLTQDGVTCNLTKASGTEGTLDGTYTATFGSTVSFVVTVTVGSRINAVVPPSTADHNYKETYIVEPTCIEGLIRRTCMDCKFTPTDLIAPPVQEHVREKTVLQEATCSLVESGVYKCTVCGNENPYSFDGKFDPTKHAKKVNDPGVVIEEPSSQRAGLKRFNCKDCGADILEEIPPIDESFSFTIPILNIKIDTDKRTFKTALIIIFASIPLVAGILLTFIFTFTKKKSKAAGYKFRFNTIEKGKGGSNKSVSEQLAEMHLVDELPPDVDIDENGQRDDEAAWTAYVDALNNDYTRTIELNIQKEIDSPSIDEIKPDSGGNAWEAYVEAISKDYEHSMEQKLNGDDDKSLADLMADTVVDSSLYTPTHQEITDGEDDELLDLGTPMEGDDDLLDLGTPTDDILNLDEENKK